MPLIAHDVVRLRQIDTASPHGQQAGCSGAAVTADTGNDFGMTEGGTPGVSVVTSTAAASATQCLFFFESIPLPYDSWTAGKWLVQFQYVSGGVGCTVDSIYICRLNLAGVSQGTVASATGLTYAISSFSNLRATEIVLDQAADIAAAANDRIFVVVVVTNSTGAPVDILWTPNAMVITPIRKTIYISEWVGFPKKQPAHPVMTMRCIPPSAVTSTAQVIDAPVVRASLSVQKQIRVLGGEALRL